MSHPNDPDWEPDYEAIIQARQYATPAEMDAAADRAWGDRLDMSDAAIENYERRNR